MMRLAGKIAIVVGAGQSPGAGIGNARATVLRFAQEGPKMLAVDGDLVLADETAVPAAKRCLPRADFRGLGFCRKWATVRFGWAITRGRGW